VHDDPTPTPVDDPLGAPGPPDAEGVRWDIVGWTDAKPFSGQLVWSDETGPLVWVDLDPILVRDLGAGLTRVLAAQREAMGVSPDPGPVPGVLDVPVETLTDDFLDDLPDDETVLAVSQDFRSALTGWVRTHRFLAVLLSIIAAFLLFYFIAGALSV
jgi:hypothetical protein